jgi:PDZ domain-containing protein
VPTRPSRRHLLWAVPLVLVAAVPPAVIVARYNASAAKYAITPGDASPSEERVSVPKDKSHVGKGDVLFVTVGVPHLNTLALDIAAGWKSSLFTTKGDADVDIRKPEDVLGSATPEQNRQENLRLMRGSKNFAAYVALRKLGYNVSVTGGGALIDSLCLQASDDGKTCVKQGPAAKVLQARDVVTAIDGKPVNVTPDITDALKGKKPGDTVTVTYKRGPDEHSDPVELTQSADGRTIIGILPNPSPPDTVKFTFPFDVSIDSGEVGGPSAGLAFTLALLDKLTPGDLTGGVTVAATGEMSPSGVVGEIGGLRQKTVAVMRTDAKVFLVPKAQMQEAVDEVAAKHSALKIVGVDTVDDALQALGDLGGNATHLGTPGATS